MTNLSAITRNFLKEMGVKSSNEFVEENILTHPQRSTLLAIAETLDRYNIENIAIKTDATKLEKLPLPCIVQDRSGQFLILTKYSSTNVQCLTTKGVKKDYSLDKFLEKWNGVCLLAEPNINSVEPGLAEKEKDKKKSIFLGSFIIILFFSWVYSLQVSSEIFSQTPFIVGVYTFIKIVGLTIGIILLWYDIDKKNPALQKFCSSKGIMDCKSVLESKHSKIFKKGPSLNILLFSYFFGTFGFIVLTHFTQSSKAFLSVLSLLTVPVIAYSLIYQGLIIKKWCKLCLFGIFILILEIVSSLLIPIDIESIDFLNLPLLLSLFLTPLVLWTPIKNLIEKNQNARINDLNLRRFKSIPVVLSALLKSSQKLSVDTKGIGIELKNPNSTYSIIVVSHPYCGPCAKAHQILEKLYQESKIDLQIIFSVGSNQNDIQTKLVKYFLAIHEDPNLNILGALEDWYSLESKDFKNFTSSYELLDKLEAQENKIYAMDNWCESENSHMTPTIYIDGYKFPDDYTIDDLKYILQSTPEIQG